MKPSTVLTLFELFGFLLAAYGLLRQSIADVARRRPYGEGRFDEGAFGGDDSDSLTWLLRLGVFLRLLPTDQELTLADHRWNPLLAILGVLLGAMALLLEAILL